MITSLSDIINVTNKTSFLIGASRSGKTSFIKLLLRRMEKKEVFLFIKDANEWSTNNYNHRIHIYTTVNPFETPILKEANNIPNGSVVILDDYVHLFLTKSNHLARFQNLIYVEASHKQLTVIFSIQSTVHILFLLPTYLYTSITYHKPLGYPPFPHTVRSF